MHTGVRRRVSKLNNICMLSTHGYFDPVPQLGQTDTGGQVVYVLQLAKALASNDIRVDIYTRWFEKSRRQIEFVPAYSDVRVIRIPAGPWEFIPKEKIYDVLPELTANMVQFIKKQSLDYDLFHGHYVDAGIVAIDIGEIFHKPVFFTAHSIGAWKREKMRGDSVEMEAKYNFKHRIAEELRIFKTVRAQTVTTQLQREKIDELYGFSSDNITVISPGVDVHTFHPSKPEDKKIEAGLPNKYIFCLSRIDANKGHDLLLQAFDIVKDRIPDVDLVIGGGSPKPQQTEKEVLSTMKRITNEKKMQDRVRFVGYIPDELLVTYYQQAQVFVLPSIFEPFGMTVLEAMSCAIPVVASKFGGIRTVINSGENGLLVDPADEVRFAEAIIRILEDRSLAEHLGNEGSATIHRYFSWEAIAEKHIQFYRKHMI